LTVDPSDRDDLIAAAKHNYIAGEFGINRLRACLVLCGLNATEIDDFISEHREAAFAAFQERNRRPVK
jgi:hypothetical protein